MKITDIKDLKAGDVIIFEADLNSGNEEGAWEFLGFSDNGKFFDWRYLRSDMVIRGASSHFDLDSFSVRHGERNRKKAKKALGL